MNAKKKAPAKRIKDLDTLALPSPGREVVGLPCLSIIILREIP